MSGFDLNQWHAHVAAANAAAANAAAAATVPTQQTFSLTADQSAAQAQYAAYQAVYGLGGAAVAPRPASVVTSLPAGDPQAAALAAFYASAAAAPQPVKPPQTVVPSQSAVDVAHAAFYQNAAAAQAQQNAAAVQAQQNAAAQAQLAAYQAAVRSATPQAAAQQTVNPAAAHAMAVAAAAAAAAKTAQTTQSIHHSIGSTTQSQYPTFSHTQSAVFSQSQASAVSQSQASAVAAYSQAQQTAALMSASQTSVSPVTSQNTASNSVTSRGSNSPASNGPTSASTSHKYSNSANTRGAPFDASRSHGPGGFRPRGPSEFRGPPPRGFGPRGPPDFGPRGPPRGFRPRGPPPMDMDRFGPRPRWGPPDDGPPGRWGPRDDGPPPGRWGPYDNGPPNRWGPPRGRFGRSRSPPREHSRRYDDDRRSGSRHDKPPSLMDLDVGNDREDRGDRRRKRSYPHDDDYRHSSKHRHVDEDLTVTISGNDREDEREEDDHQYYCTTCKVYLRNSSDFQQHLRGKRHKQRLSDANNSTATAAAAGCVDTAAVAAVAAEFEEGEEPMYTDKNVCIDPTLTLIPADDPEKSKLYCITCRLALVTEENKLYHDHTPTHLNKVKELEDLKASISEDKDVCMTCHIVYDKASESDHIATEKHQESLHWRMAFCEICSCKYNCASSLETHMEQSKHVKQLAKLQKMGMSADILTKYFNDVTEKRQEKRTSFCLICTTVCGTNENMELHNILAEDYHERKIFRSRRATEFQFYCFCCEVVEESDRRAHAKNQRHKSSKDRKRRWTCEDCREYYNDESGLMSHLNSNRHIKQVQRRKKIEEHTKKQCMSDWKRKIISARSAIIEKLPKSEGETHEGVKGCLAAEIKSSTEVIPVAGDYCSVCNQFYMIDSDPAELCEHVRTAKGIELAGDNTEPEVEEFTEPIVKPSKIVEDSSSKISEDSTGKSTDSTDKSPDSTDKSPDSASKSTELNAESAEETVKSVELDSAERGDAPPVEEGEGSSVTKSENDEKVAESDITEGKVEINPEDTDKMNGEDVKEAQPSSDEQTDGGDKPQSDQISGVEAEEEDTTETD